MNSPRRDSLGWVVAAALLACLAVPLASLCGYAALWICNCFGFGGPFSGLIRPALAFTAVVTAVGYLVMLVFGLPAVIALWSRGGVTLPHLVAVGALGGIMPIAVLEVSDVIRHSRVSSTRDLVAAVLFATLGAVFGMLTGAVLHFMLRGGSTRA